jgi:uncharacterized membrane protein YdjX (TVP38/TMEM64 family)
MIAWMHQVKAVGVFIGTLLVFFVIALLPIPWKALGIAGYLGVLLGTMWGGLGAFAPSPAMALVISAGRVLDPVLVGITGGLGFALGEVVLFGVMRRTPDRFFPSWVFPVRLQALFSRLERSWWWWPVVYGIAVIPTPLFDLVTIWSARTEIAIHKYLIPIASGRITRSIMLAFIGATHQYTTVHDFLLNRLTH